MNWHFVAENSLRQNLHGDVFLPRPFRNCLKFAFKLKKPVVPFVGTLLDCGFPTAISGFVISIIINSSNRSAIGFGAHVGEEVFKPEPPLADFYSSTSVIWKAFHMRIKAAFFHFVPCPVFGSETIVTKGNRLSVSFHKYMLTTATVCGINVANASPFVAQKCRRVESPCQSESRFQRGETCELGDCSISSNP